MVKPLFLGNWAELIAMTTKYPWARDANQFIGQNTTPLPQKKKIDFFCEGGGKTVHRLRGS